jgi:F-type H+-transporting ATPase subunit delta
VAIADSTDKHLATADVYADALFSLARESGAIDDVRSELEQLVELEHSEPAFGVFMTSSALDDDRREAGLDKMLRGRLSDITLNTLLVMNRNGRYGMTDSLLRAFVIRQTDAANQIEVIATSAVPLDDAQRKHVLETAARISGRTPLVDFRVDAGLLGGLIVQIGDVRYDNSVRSQLQVARQRLLARSESGLAVGRE